jgi:hypothetical protein
MFYRYLVLINLLFKVLKWIGERIDNLYVERMGEGLIYLEDILENVVEEDRGGDLSFI